MELALKYFKDQGHKVLAFLPTHYIRGESRLYTTEAKRAPDDVALLERLSDEGSLILTPPQDYDDDYMIEFARRWAPPATVAV